MAAVVLSAHFLVPAHSQITKSGQELQCALGLTDCRLMYPYSFTECGPNQAVKSGRAADDCRSFQIGAGSSGTDPPGLFDAATSGRTGPLPDEFAVARLAPDHVLEAFDGDALLAPAVA